MKYFLSLILILISLFGFSQNDDCANSQTITPDGTCYTGTLVGANDNWSGEVGCATSGGPNNHIDVWYSFVATGTQFDITVTDISISGTLEIILVSPNTLPCGGPFTVHYSVCGSSPLVGSYGGLTPGNTYYYTVSSPNNNVGSFETCVTNSTPAVSGNQNCSSATAICSNNPFPGNSSGYDIQELNSTNAGCLSVEHQSSWYTFTIQSGGTLSMTIAPTAADDYDFAIWGPNPDCPPTTNPIRCSWAAGSGNTGMTDGSGDNSEGVFGDKWVEDLNVNAGETYVLLIDNFSSSGNPFNLNWGGTAILDCAVLPIELAYFYGYEKDTVNVLHWVTLSEINNDYFILEKSENGINWVELGKVNGIGNSNYLVEYEYIDENPFISDTYYRLSQIDFDGNKEYFEIIVVHNNTNLFYPYFKNGDDNIYLSSPRHYQIFNVFGQQIISGNGDYIVINNLSPGVYVLVIGSYKHKFIIK